jgi:hypothetical protein
MKLLETSTVSDLLPVPTVRLVVLVAVVAFKVNAAITELSQTIKAVSSPIRVANHAMKVSARAENVPGELLDGGGGGVVKVGVGIMDLLLR